MGYKKGVFEPPCQAGRNGPPSNVGCMKQNNNCVQLSPLTSTQPPNFKPINDFNMKHLALVIGFLTLLTPTLGLAINHVPRSPLPEPAPGFPGFLDPFKDFVDAVRLGLNKGTKFEE